ncbi:MAG: hydroxymethylbilane synthase [Lachnospirales bacterium]
MNKTIKIGTRKSDLALAQTNLVIDELKKVNNSLDFEIVTISTKGDEILNRPLLEFGGKGVFIDEFEKALLNQKIDIAIHSAKDMPREIPQGLGILGVLKRDDPRDVLISNKNLLNNNPLTVGTGSLRRQYQIKQLYNVACHNLRGNVPTRLNALRENKFDAIILASAGLNRLNLHNLKEFTYTYFNIDDFIPASGQGIIAIEGRIDDELQGLINAINDENTSIALNTERNILKELQGSCHEMIGAYSYIKNKTIYIYGIYEVDGKVNKTHIQGDVKNYMELSYKLTKELLNNE